MISNAYRYYISEYSHSVNAKYDTHSRAQLKSSTGKVLKSNSRSPLYKIDMSEEAQRYAIDLKEHARQLSFLAQDFSDDDGEELHFKKNANSSNEAAVEVEFVGEDSEADIPVVELGVKRIATPQINGNNFLPSQAKHLPAGEYSFDLNISNLTYEFQFEIGADDTTLDVQNRLSRLINRSRIGLKADILEDSLGNTALNIRSDATGIPGIKPTIFSINATDNVPSNQRMIDTFGLDRVAVYPENAIFTIDGHEHYSSENEFVVNNTYAVKLKAPTEEPAQLYLSANDESMVDTIEELLSGYNSIIETFSSEANLAFSGNTKLLSEFTRLTNYYRDTFTSSGFNIEDDGRISIDKAAMLEVIRDPSDNSLDNIFDSINDFRKAMGRKADNLATNPMNYVTNQIVAYKNPANHINDPYNISAYSGMMFTGYI